VPRLGSAAAPEQPPGGAKRLDQGKAIAAAERLDPLADLGAGSSASNMRRPSAVRLIGRRRASAPRPRAIQPWAWKRRRMRLT
jgi:hypothetical protein